MDFSDCREVDGVKIAFAQSVTNPAMRMTTKVLEVVHNRELPDEMFHPRKKGEIPVQQPSAAPVAEPAKAVPEATATPPTVPAAPGK